MEALFAALEATSIAQFLRGSRWGYAAVSFAHILGFALLIGAIVPLNLRLLGLWPAIPRPQLMRVLVPAATFGLALAVSMGLLLFSVRAQDYSEVIFLRAKLALILIGIVSAMTAHLRYGLTLEGASSERLKAHAFISLGCWLGALACGRLIAFAMD
jgi:hypothetical protein